MALDDSGAEIALPGRKARALLAYLAVNAGRPQPRDRLAALLWGDRFDDQARQSLRQGLSKLRKALRPGAAEALVVSGEEVMLDPDAVDIDARRFAALAADGGEAALAEAAGLYRDDLCAGLDAKSPAFEDWLGPERARLRDLACSVLDRLAEQRVAHGEVDGAIEAARRLVVLDPLREDAHRRLMRLHAARGERAAALRQYRACAETLARELGTAPDQATRALHDEIRAQNDAPPRATATAGAKCAHAGALPIPPRPAVAVLPFANLSGDPEQEYFADGITEDIITSLSYWRWFPVIARNSTMAYKGRAVPVDRIARELDARYVVEGSVRRAADKVRITAQLVDAETGHHLWAQRYDRDLNDLFALQDEITECIVAGIEPELHRAEQRHALRKKPGDLTTWDHVVRAMWHKSDLTRERNREAIGLLERALELDPNSSYALVQLAQCQWHEGIFGWARDPAAAFAACDECARRAVGIDDGDWQAHCMLGMSDLWYRREHDAALARLERALALNPSAASAHHGMACALELCGRPGEALPHLETVRRLDPGYLNSASLYGDFALTHLLLGDFEQAARHARQSIAAMPHYARGHQRLVSSLGHLGRRDEAEAALGELLRLQPDFSASYVECTYPFRDRDDLELLLEGLRRAGWSG